MRQHRQRAVFVAAAMGPGNRQCDRRAAGAGFEGNGIAHIQNFNGALAAVVRTRSGSSCRGGIPRRTRRSPTCPRRSFCRTDIIRSIDDQFVRDALLRLTWQVNQKNKFSVWYERSGSEGKDFVFGQDPRRGAAE